MKIINRPNVNISFLRRKQRLNIYSDKITNNKSVKAKIILPKGRRINLLSTRDFATKFTTYHRLINKSDKSTRATL
jgi:hypothetical protein